MTAPYSANLSMRAHASSFPDAGQVQDDSSRSTPVEHFCALLTAFAQANERTLDDADRELQQALSMQARYGDQRCDLAKLSVPVMLRLPPAIWSAFGEACSRREPPVTELILPRGLRTLPFELKNFPMLRSLALPRFRGRKLDLSGLAQLRMLALGTVSHNARIRVVIPLACEKIDVQLADKEVPEFSVRRDDEQGIAIVDIKPRELRVNGVVPFVEAAEAAHDADEVIPGDLIWCRHIAVAIPAVWAEAEVLGMDPDERVASIFGTPGGVAANVPPKLQAVFNKLVAQPRDGHLVVEELWANFVDDQFRELERSGQGRACALVLSQGHVIPARIDRSPDRKSMVLFCDPNTPTRPCTGTGTTPLRNLFCSDAEYKTAFCHEMENGQIFHYVTVIMIPDAMDPMSGVAKKSGDISLSVKWAGLSPQWHPGAVYKIAECGRPKLLKAFLDHLRTADLTAQQCRELVTCRGPEGLPCFYWVAEYQRTQSVQALGEAMVIGHKRGLVSKQEIQEILRAKDQYGDNVLSMAVRLNRPQMVEEFSRVLLRLYKKKVLSALEVYQLMQVPVEKLLDAPEEFQVWFGKLKTKVWAAIGLAG